VARYASRGAFAVESAGRLGKQVGQEAVAVQLEKGIAGAALAENLVDLLENAGRAAAHDLAAQGADGLLAVAVDGKAEAGGEGHGSKHAHGIFAQAHPGIADRGDHPLPEVAEAADPIDDREGGDVVEEGVDREVAPEGVLLRGAEGVVAANEGVAFLGFGLAPEGGHLDDLPAEPDVAQAEPPSHHEAVAEELLHLRRMRRSADVEVLGLPLEQEVAHAAPDEVGHEPVVPQAIENLEGVGVDVLAGDDVLGARQDAWGDVAGLVLH
jgi:hypothetical protein